MKKRLFFIMFVLMAIATGAWADAYGVYICGVMVTDDNINSLSSIDGVKGGTITFDGTTLTLTDVTIDASNKPCYGMSHMQDDLTIHLVGTNRIFSDLAAVCLRGYTTITGPGKLEATGKEQGIILEDIRQRYTLRLTIQDEAHIVAKGDKYGIYGKTSYEDVLINRSTKEIDAWGGDGSFCNMSGIYIRRPLEVFEPTGAKVSDNYKNIVDADGNVVKGKWVKIADPSSGLAINETNFPDPVFRAYVKEECQSDGDDILTDEEIAAVTEIYFNTSSIADLKGIEFFTALKQLSCINCSLTSLDLSNNTALDYLECSHNNLTSLDLSNNTALTYLDCANNQLTKLNVSNNTALKTFFCSNNQLTRLDVSNNTALTLLWCDNNDLNYLYLLDNTALKILDCSYTRLNNLDLSNNTALKELNCSVARLTSLDLSNNTALTYVFCFYNPLTSLVVSKEASSLVQIGCFYCQIKGAAMDKLVESLPNNDKDKNLYVYIMDDEYEGNEMTVRQVAAAKKKKWYAGCSDSNIIDWYYYDGIDAGDTPTAIPTVTLEADSDSPFYSLDGQRIVGKPTKKGVYVRDGRKVVVK